MYTFAWLQFSSAFIAAAIANTQKDKDHSLPVLQVYVHCSMVADLHWYITNQEKMEELNKQIEKENQLKNLTSLNLSAATDSVAKSMASEKVGWNHSINSAETWVISDFLLLMQLTECSENLEAFRVELYRYVIVKIQPMCMWELST